tara:strand:- start:1437 stop:2966 length:1530 start_codon:yes stop_codon:yes gene_type:complete
MLRLINSLRAAAAVVMTGRSDPATSTTNDLPEVVLPTRGKSAPEPHREPSSPAPPPVVRSKTDSAAKSVDTSGLVLMRRFLRPKVGDAALTAAEARALVIFVRTLPLRLIRLSPVPVSFYCQICLQHQPLNEPHTQLPCGHRFCRGCLLEYLAHKIESAEVVPLQCPHFGDAAEGTDPRCTFDVNEEQLVALGVQAALLTKYRKFVARQTVETHRECPQCEASNISGPSLLSNQLTCGQCETKFCYVHGGAHPGLFCWQWEWHQRKARVDEAARAAAAAEAATNETLNRYTKRCPHRRCGAPTIKSSGCNHITCRQCHKHWCWRCGATISNGSVSWHFNTANRAGCPGHMFSNVEMPADLPADDSSTAAAAPAPPPIDHLDVEAQVAVIPARNYFRECRLPPECTRAVRASCEFALGAIVSLLMATLLIPYLAFCLAVMPAIPILAAPLATIGWLCCPKCLSCKGSGWCGNVSCGPTDCCGFYACLCLMMGAMLWAPMDKLGSVLLGEG